MLLFDVAACGSSIALHCHALCVIVYFNACCFGGFWNWQKTRKIVRVNFRLTSVIQKLTKAQKQIYVKN